MCRLKWFVFALIYGAIASCGTAPIQPAQTSAALQIEAIAKLNRAVEKARDEGTYVMAPSSFERAEDDLRAAARLADKGAAAAAVSTAEEGLRAVTNAEAAARITRDILLDVAEARDRAVQANAQQLFTDEMQDADAEFAKAARLIEAGHVDEAKQEQAALVALYADVELKALKESTVSAARAAIERADEFGAMDLAPRTFKMAQDELTLAQSVLETRRGQTQTADQHARRAVDLANRAISIAELVKDFEERDATLEDVVLWHQDQLLAVTEPLQVDVDLGRSNREIVDVLRSAVTASLAVQDQLSQSQMSAAESLALRDQEITQLKQQHQAELAALRDQYEQKLALESNLAAEAERLKEEQQARFDRVQALFSEEEATVYRQRNNVLISAHGMHFPSGKSDIQEQDFPLLSKIAAAVREFPDARLHVSGHTDAIGDASLNQALSEARASTVAAYLSNAGQISPERIETTGYGSSKPVARNDTAEERARNRRIEVLIINP